MAELTLRGVRKTYGGMEVIRGIDLDIASGEFVAFVGPSGCGKSTLLRCIAGLEDISAGEFSIDGQIMNDVAPARRGIAMVFQSYALYPHMTVFQNMAFGMQISGMKKDEINRRVQKAADSLQLTPYLDRYPKALSGGQRQRVAIGRAIVRDPSVFLFDEPLSNLDAALRAATRVEIARLKKSMPQATMIYVTHDQVEAMTLADRIVVLRGGQIEQIGRPIDLYRKPANLFVARFIGSPAMNVLTGVVAMGDEGTTVRLDGGEMLDVEGAALRALAGRTVHVGIRPEDLRLVPEAEAMLRGKVALVEQLGEFQLIHVDLGRSSSGALIAKISGDTDVTEGMQVSLGARAASMHIFDEAENAVA